MKAEYLIPESNLTELEARLVKLNKRAKRLGVPEIGFTKAFDHVKARCRVLTVDGHINSHVWEFPEKIAERAAKWPCEDTGERMTWWKVEVDGETPTLPGWEFIAVLSPLETEDGFENFVRALPGHSCPAEFRTRVGECDHCHTHRKRNETFVVKHESGSHKVVGRNCVKDFLGYNGDPHTLAEWAESLAELGSLCDSAEDPDWLGEGGGNRMADAWDLKRFLAIAACRIRKAGWLGRGKAYEERNEFGVSRDATADVVLKILTPPYRPNDDDRKAWAKLVSDFTPEAEDTAKAEAAMDWAKDIPVGDNDYLANVCLVARVGAASRKTAGVAASIMVAYDRAMEFEINRMKRAAKPESHHVGEVGKRIPLMKVTVEKVIANETEWGITGIHKMTDEHGSDLTWFASSADWLKEGETYSVAASVKKHDEYKGRKNTVLTRVSAWTEEGLVEHYAKEAKKAERAAKKAAKLAKVS